MQYYNPQMRYLGDIRLDKANNRTQEVKIFPKCSPSHGSTLNNTKQEKPIPFLLTDIADGLDPAIRQLDGVASLGHP